MRHRVRVFAAGLLVVGALCAPPFSTSAQEALPPKAEKAMQRGLAAAKQQEWEIAIKYFGEAREGARRAPEVLFNLALAHDRLGGRELVAIAWFRAFLAAAPEAANAGQVRERIFELEVKVEANAAKLIAKAKEAAARLSREIDRENALIDISTAQAKAGDIAGAKETAAQIPRGYWKSLAYQGIAKAQAKAGDIAGALATLDRAKEAAAGISPDWSRSLTYAWIAQAEVRAGDIAGALATLDRAKEAAVGILEDGEKSLTYWTIAEAQAAAGDIAGAKETAARIPEDDSKSRAYRYIAKAQAEAGDRTAKAPVKEKEIAAEPYVRPYVREEEIDAWTEMVEHQLDKPLFQDLQGFIRSLTVKEPGQMIGALADAAGDLAKAMRELQQKDAEWRQRRADAQ